MKKILNLFFVFYILTAMLTHSFFAYAMNFKAETAYDSVFVIYSGTSLGSGFALGENCIITNAHVIHDKSQTQIATYSGKKYSSFVLAMDEDLDIAILGTSEATFKPLQIAKLSTVNIGDDVFAIGAPNSLSYTLTKGVVSAKDRVVGKQSFIQTDAAINSGNSGGPLLNADGKVIGVNSYKFSDSEGIGLAIPIDVVENYILKENITVDEFGNVKGNVKQQENTQNGKTEEPEIKATEPDDENQTVKIILYACLAISVLLNVFLIIVLVFQKKKNLDSKTIDPSERTDFDIDILE